MAHSYLIPAQTVTTEQILKKSRFICSIGHAANRLQAMAAIDAIRSNHPRATHVCWAFIAGAPDSAERGMSDDGEPHGTAGKPMLTLLDRTGMGEIWTTVTRYYGGIKLGTGGLVRAYSSSVQQSLKLLTTRKKTDSAELHLSCPYSLLDTLKSLAASAEAEIIREQFQETVHLVISVPSSNKEGIIARISSASRGSIVIQERAASARSDNKD